MSGGKEGSGLNAGASHALEAPSCLSYANFNWTWPYTSLVRKGSFEQTDHPNLPSKETMVLNYSMMSRNLKKHKSMLKTVLYSILKDMLAILFLTVVDAAFSGGIMMVLYYLGLELKNEVTQYARVINWQNPLLLVASLVFISFLRLYTYELMVFERERIGIRVNAGIRALIFEKMLTISLINPGECDDGSITNNIQVDSEKIQNSLWAFTQIFYYLLNFVVTLSLGIQLFGWIFNIMVVALAGSGLLLYLVVMFWYIAGSGWMFAKDKRLAYWKGIYSTIKFIKARGFEVDVYSKIYAFRLQELKWQIINSALVAMFVMLSIMFPAISVYTFLHFFFAAGNVLEVAKIAIFIKILFALAELLADLPFSFQCINEFSISINRLDKLMQTRDIDIEKIRSQETEPGVSISMKNCSFYWSKKGKKAEDKTGSDSNAADTSEVKEPLLNGSIDQSLEAPLEEEFSIMIDNLKARTGEVTFLVGTMGCGKSSLLYAIMGEMKIKNYDGELRIRGSVGYVGQRPWILNGTVKENIIMDLPFNSEKFSQAIKYSCLDEDLRSFGKGIDQETGEAGDALSGGQRTRLAIARCIYQDPDIFIFDDVLSALDSYVGSFIMEETILKLLKGKTIFMSTHAVQYLPHGNHIYMMEQGSIEAEGSFEQIAGCSMYQRYLEINKEFEKATKAGAEEVQVVKQKELICKHKESETLQAVRRVTEDDFGQTVALTIGDIEIEDELVKELMMPEDKEKGNISFKMVLIFINKFGGFLAILFPMAIIMLKQSLETYTFTFLSQWSEHFYEYNTKDQMRKYIIMNIGAGLLTGLRSVSLSVSAYFLSRNIHAKMVFAVLHCKIEDFVSRVPSGRVINRFSNDLTLIDQDLLNRLGNLYSKIGEVVISIFYLGYLLGIETSVLIFIMLVICTIYQRIFMSAQREIVRLEAITKTPALNTFNDTLKGLTNIRCSSYSRFMFSKFKTCIDDNSKNKLLQQALSRWYNIRSGLISILVVLTPSYLLIIFYFKKLTMSDIAVSLYLGTTLSRVINDLLINYSRVESAMIAVERCHHFEKIEPEPQYKSYKKDFALVDGSKSSIEKLKKRQIENTERIVTEGSIEFKDMSCKYATSQNPILSKLSFAIKPREKIGVIGRTGSGKSTLIKLLWRALDFYEGDIKIDGKSIKEVDLKSLRSQIMIVTQETALIEGTLRENIDIRLEDKSKDAEITEILTRLGFANPNYLKDGLDMAIDGEGSNLSAGEKQLISFARTLLDKKKIMILDEATANIDLKTEEKIQACVDQDFKDTTMLIIAHRIQTIMNCDRILILEKGKMAALDTPANLSNQKDSYFNNIINKMKEKKS